MWAKCLSTSEQTIRNIVANRLTENFIFRNLFECSSNFTIDIFID